MGAKRRTAETPVALEPQTGPTAYETLGVAPTTPLRQIRLAYLAMIKLSHPDIAQPNSTGPTAIELNKAYWWLSNAERRRQYDNSLAVMFPVTMRTAPAICAPVLRPARARWGMLLAAAASTAAAAAWLAYVHTPGPIRFADGALTMTSVDPLAASGQRPAIVREAGLNFEWVALQSDEPTVARYSLGCWTNLASDASENLLDYCLAFDSVARHTFGRASKYFALPAMIARGRAAAGALGAGEPSRSRITRVEALLARSERRATSALKYHVNWFPMTPEADLSLPVSNGARPTGR